MRQRSPCCSNIKEPKVVHGHNAAHQRVQSATRSGRESGIEFDLLDLLLVMAERKYTIILATLIGLFLGTVLVLLMHPVFTSQSCDPATAAGAVERRPGEPAG